MQSLRMTSDNFKQWIRELRLTRCEWCFEKTEVFYILEDYICEDIYPMLVCPQCKDGAPKV